MFNRFTTTLTLTWFLAGAAHAADPLTNYPAAKPGDAGYVSEDPQLAQLVGRPAPRIALRSINGKTIDIVKSYGSQPVYLKIWATYCIPCRAQMPGFEKIYREYGKQIQIVAVNAGIGDDLDKVRKFVAKAKIHMPVAMDDGTLVEWLDLDSTPFHLLIGKDGRIAYAGHQDGPKLDEALERVLEDARQNIPIETRDGDSVIALKPGDTVPTIRLTGPDNTALEFARTGRPRAVLFTASWCESYLKDTEPKTAAACRRVREQVDELSQDASVEWLAVVTRLWTTPKALASYQARLKTRVPMAIDTEGQAFRIFGVHAFPAVAFIDARGRLIRVAELRHDHDLVEAVKKLTATPEVFLRP